MLRVEITNGISDTLLQILDMRQIKKLIPVIENQRSEHGLPLEDNDIDEIKEIAEMIHTPTVLLRSKTMRHTKIIEEKIQAAKEKIINEEKVIPKLQIQKKIETEIKETLSPVIITEKNKKIEEAIPKTLDGLISTFRDDKSEENLLKEINEKESEISFDPIHFQEELDQLTIEVRSLHIIKEDSLQMISNCTESLKNKVFQAQNEFCANVMILTEECKQVTKQRAKDLSDINASIESALKEIYEKMQNIDSIDQKIGKISEVVQGTIEIIRILHALILQDEEDRKGLQLTGYSENKQNTKSNLRSRLSVSLKPECMSCNGPNALIFTAFKMACLNYFPSEVKFNSKFYPRQVLIQKAGEFLNGIGEKSNILPVNESIKAIIINDDSSLRLKSNARGRNTSRYILDVSSSKPCFDPETPLHSRREIKLGHKLSY